MDNRPLAVERQEAIDAFVNEVVAECSICHEPVRRNQSRKLINEISVGVDNGYEWKREYAGGQLVHWECAA